MRIITARWPFILLILAGILVLFVSIYDMVFQKDWFLYVIASYVVLIIIAIILLILTWTYAPEIFKELAEFEKIAEAKKVQHFKCPQCGGFFAVQEGKRKQKHRLKMTCLNCGVIGSIPLKPQTLTDAVPEKKSKSVTFICDQCLEEITVWAEGSDIRAAVQITVCPYCGREHTLRKTKQ